MDTATENAETYEAPAKPRRGPYGLLLLCLILGSTAAGGAAGALGLFAPVYDLALGHGAAAAPHASIFYPLPEFRIAIDALSEYRPSSPSSFGRQLRAVVQLEVEADRKSHVDALQPRIVDTLLSFLHALNERDLASTRTLHRLKAQMLHRVRQVTGADAVRDVLITDFALL